MSASPRRASSGMTAATPRRAATAAAGPPPPPALSPHLGLVCITSDLTCRFRTITRTRYLRLDVRQRQQALDELYRDNLARLHGALSFCRAHGIRLYRATSNLFPMSDDPLGEQVLRAMSDDLAEIGPRAGALGIRVVLHPDQFVVLNSDAEAVRAGSIQIMQKHALSFDLMRLPRTPWSAMTLHGGKAGRADRLVEVIQSDLPANVRDRLVLENDEYAYSAGEILDICRRARVPMVFDCHHHLIKEGLDTYEHPSVAEFTRLARATWPDPSWQVVHVSNGRSELRDRNHSDFITTMPSAFRDVGWIEVEAKAKEKAIERLRAAWPAV